MTTQPKKQLRITGCRDALMWYAGLVGQTVPYLGTWPEGYRSREPAGYINVVRFQDAEVIDVEADSTAEPITEISSDRHSLQADGAHPAPCARTCEATAFRLEIRRLKAALTRAELACVELRAAEKLQESLVPEWDEDGEARTLAAAAYDADEWMALIQRLNDSGRGPWKFSDPESAEKLRGCRKALRKLLPIDESGRKKELTK